MYAPVHLQVDKNEIIERVGKMQSCKTIILGIRGQIKENLLEEMSDLIEKENLLFCKLLTPYIFKCPFSLVRTIN